MNNKNFSNVIYKDASVSVVETDFHPLAALAIQEQEICNENEEDSVGVETSFELNLLPEIVRENIWKWLSITALKKLRMMNSFWCAEATKHYLSNHITGPIETAYSDDDHPGSNKINCLISNTNSSADLTSFVKMVAASKEFPCNNFEIELEHLDTTGVQFFLDIHGASIRRLRILNQEENDSEVLELKIWENLLTKQVTKLHSLDIFIVPPLNSWEIPSTVKLLYLRELNLDFFYPLKINVFLPSLLNAAINLKKVSSYTFQGGNVLDIMAILVSCGKAHLLFECAFFHEGRYESNGIAIRSLNKQLQILQKYIDSNPKPKPNTIEIDFFLPSITLELQPFVALAVSNYFEKFAQSLTHLLFRDKHFFQFPQLYIPPLPQVRVLEIHDFVYNYFEIFEGKLDTFGGSRIFSDIFPNLEFLMLREVNGRNRTVDDVIVPSDLVKVVPHWSLKSFVLHKAFTPILPAPLIIFQYFGIKFPNVTEMTFPPTQDFVATAQLIWTSLIHLNSMEICIHRSALLEDCYPGIESAFTGFSSETCIRFLRCIAEEKEVEVEIPNWKDLRINPSILNLTNLKSFKLKFDKDSWVGWDPTELILTAVTGRFAFSMLDELNVTISGGPILGWSQVSNPFLGLKPYVTTFHIGF